jgi:formamidopyrimidine-DNA glycosylase
MPELPEVEFARQSLLRWLEGRRVVRAQAQPEVRTFRQSSPEDFERLRGRLLEATRRGKYLLLAFERDLGLLAHLGMTGKFVRRPQGHPEPYSRARLHLDDGSVIHFRDPRLFGRLQVVPATALEQQEVIRGLGPDPLRDGLDAKLLRERLGPSRQDLKVALMDQARLAGLGNIHAAEALYRAGLHPARAPQSLTGAEWRRLASAIHQSLAFALEGEQGEEIEYVEEPGAQNPFRIYGRAGEKCARCGGKVRSFTQAGRTTHYCPGCQPKRPKP